MSTKERLQNAKSLVKCPNFPLQWLSSLWLGGIGWSKKLIRDAPSFPEPAQHSTVDSGRIISDSVFSREEKSWQVVGLRRGTRYNGARSDRSGHQVVVITGRSCGYVWVRSPRPWIRPPSGHDGIFWLQQRQIKRQFCKPKMTYTFHDLHKELRDIPTDTTMLHPISQTHTN